jgi:hypothetical protein
MLGPARSTDPLGWRSTGDDAIIASADATWEKPMADVLAARAREQDALIELARGYVEQLAADRNMVGGLRRRLRRDGDLNVRSVARGDLNVWSVARGDLNVWSDVDVVVADNSPSRAPDRAPLGQIAPPRVQPISFTPLEFRTSHAKGHWLARQTVELGVGRGHVGGALTLKGDAT